ncbi:MAG: hypothetical protein FJZ94_09225, partial [Chloroflexi bacterium]|nr:hypothetical protein [Chloroflexota bacterium]
MKKKATNNLEAIAEKIRDFFSTRDTAREEVIRLCREVIRYSANAIRAVHRQDQTGAKQLLGFAHNSLRQISKSVPKEHNDLLYGGIIHDAQKEFAEANITLAL